jgi:hypothetical protein
VIGGYGIDLTIQSGWSTTTSMGYAFSQSGHGCGYADYPPGNAKLITADY